VPAAHQKAAQALIVTSAFACLACCAPAADFRRAVALAPEQPEKKQKTDAVVAVVGELCMHGWTAV
jgi:hypothetical protein